MSKQQTIGYEVDGHVVKSLEELSDLLGVEKITSKDLAEGGEYADLVSMVDLAPVLSGKSKSESSNENINKNEVFTALTEDAMKELETVDPESIKATLPDFESVDEVKEFIKDIDTPTLEYIATALGLEWRPTYHANIHRMRIAMELKRYFFPEEFKPKSERKKKAKYGDFDTETLFDMLKEHDIEVKKTGNEPIDRMKAIMELKKSGILPE